MQTHAPHKLSRPATARAVKPYIDVAKPGIVFGNLVAAAGGALLAFRGDVDFVTLFAALGGIALVIASACVLNNCIDRDIDALMARTRGRVMVRRLIPMDGALVYAGALGIAGTALLWFFTNPLAVAVTLAGFFIYVAVYTVGMKRRSVHSALVGSLSGAAPPVAGYCAVTGTFDPGAALLLAIFCLWQMPHWFAIAIFRKDDYEAAAIPVLPTLRGMEATRVRIALYIAAYTLSAMMLTLAGYTGAMTLAVVLAFGAWWLTAALERPDPRNERRWAKKVFGLSILNVMALSVMMAVDFG